MWIEASGQGTVYSHTVLRRTSGHYRDVEALVIAYVELEEGPRILTNIIDCEPEAVEVGAAVALRWSITEDGVALYRFCLA